MKRIFSVNLKMNLAVTVLMAAMVGCSNGANSNTAPPHSTNNQIWTDSNCAIHNDGYASRWSGKLNGTLIQNVEVCSNWYLKLNGVKQKNFVPTTVSLNSTSLQSNLLGSMESYTVINATGSGANWIHFGMPVSVGTANESVSAANNAVVEQISISQIPSAGSITSLSTAESILQSVINNYFPSSNLANVTTTNWNGNATSYNFPNLPLTLLGKSGGSDYFTYPESVTALGIPSLGDNDYIVSSGYVYIWQTQSLMPLTLYSATQTVNSQNVAAVQAYIVDWNGTESNLNPYNCTYVRSSVGTVNQSTIVSCNLPSTIPTYTFSVTNLFSGLSLNTSSGSACELSNSSAGCSQNGVLFDYSVAYPSNFPSGGNYQSTCRNVKYDNSSQSLSAECPFLIYSYNSVIGIDYVGYYSIESDNSSTLTYSTCSESGGVNNVSGNLVCNAYPAPLPTGNYTSYCYKVSESNGVLTANCGDGNATFNYASICASPVVNVINAHMVCAESYNLPIPNGDYTQSCYSLNMSESGILTGECLAKMSSTTGPGYGTATLNYNSFCASNSTVSVIPVNNPSGVVNVGAGNLLCDSPGAGATQSATIEFDITTGSCQVMLQYSGATPPSNFISADVLGPVYPNQPGGCGLAPSNITPTCSSEQGLDVNVCTYNSVFNTDSSGINLYINSTSNLNPVTFTATGYQPLTLQSESFMMCLSTQCPASN